MESVSTYNSFCTSKMFVLNVQRIFFDKSTYLDLIKILFVQKNCLIVQHFLHVEIVPTNIYTYIFTRGGGYAI